jgi:hypothetical protein
MRQKSRNEMSCGSDFTELGCQWAGALQDKYEQLKTSDWLNQVDIQ